MKKAKLLLALLSLTACEDPSAPTLPELSEVKITDLGPHHVYVDAFLNKIGDHDITEHGFTISLDSNSNEIYSKLGAINRNEKSPKKLSTEFKELKANTKYFVKTYATYNGTTVYGSTKSFTTSPIEMPTIQTLAAEAIEGQFAKFRGIITSAGNLQISQYGFVWSHSEHPTIDNASRHALINYGQSLPINFEYVAVDLNPETKYYFRSYLKANDTFIYGEEMSFITQNIIAPKIRTGEAIPGETSLVLKGEILAPGTKPITEYGMTYGTDNNIQIKIKASDAALSTYPTAFDVSVNNLHKGTTYQYTAYAISGGVTTYGEIKTITLGSTAPQMQTLSPLALTPVSATLVGKLLSAGDYAVSEVGIIWSKNTDPNLQNGQQLKLSNINQPLPFSFQFKVDNLVPENKYYYRTYTISRGQVYYGETKSFTTGKLVATAVKTNNQLEKDDNGNLLISAEITQGTYRLVEFGFLYAYSENEPHSKIKVPATYNNPLKIKASIPNPGCGKSVLVRAYALDDRGVNTFGDKLNLETEQC